METDIFGGGIAGKVSDRDGNPVMARPHACSRGRNLRHHELIGWRALVRRNDFRQHIGHGRLLVGSGLHRDGLDMPEDHRAISLEHGEPNSIG